MHNIERLPGARIITGVLWVILIGGLAAYFFFNPAGFAPGTRVDEHISLSVLRSEALTFLVTRRTATQVVVEHEESSWLGQWRGVLWATVHIHYGVNLAKIQARDIRRDGNVAFVKLPEPDVLDFSLEPGSVGVLSKSTAVPKIEDLLNNGHRRVLEARLRESALEFARQRGMLPTRDELIGQLNKAVSLLASEGGVRLRFE